MKTKISPIAGLALGAAVLFTAVSTRADEGEFYVKGDVGGTLARDVNLREFYGPVIPNSKIKLDPGIRVGVRAGYGLTDWFDAEVETGIMANRVDTITGATEQDASLAHFPLLFNARIHCPTRNRISPYIGGGIGFSTVVLNADDIVIGGTRMDGAAGGVALAYQAFAGVRCAINGRMGISLEYHYFGTSSSHSHADVAIGTTTDRLSLGRTESHAISLAFDFKF